MGYARAILPRRRTAASLFPRRWSSLGTDPCNKHRVTTTMLCGAAGVLRECSKCASKFVVNLHDQTFCILLIAHDLPRQKPASSSVSRALERENRPPKRGPNLPALTG